jgi:aminopeptidase N
MNSPLTQRLDDIRALRERQFVEDAGPTAHPIKPDHYMEINNFYTATVYEKGAEVIRMMHTLLGGEKFRAAMDYYFEKFDGKAVGTEEFLESMQSQSPVDLTQFKRWYSQERTPTLRIRVVFSDAAELVLRIVQNIPKTHRPEQLPYALPLTIALLSEEGKEFDLITSDCILLNGTTLWITDEITEVTFSALSSAPKLSLNRHFSTPVIIECEELDYPFLMTHDRDGFVRYEASHLFGIETLEAMMNGSEANERYVESYGALLRDASMDPMFKSQALELPSVTTLMEETIDVAAVSMLRYWPLGILMNFKSIARCTPSNTDIDGLSIGKRSLKIDFLGF